MYSVFDWAECTVCPGVKSQQPWGLSAPSADSLILRRAAHFRGELFSHFWIDSVQRSIWTQQVLNKWARRHSEASFLRRYPLTLVHLLHGPALCNYNNNINSSVELGSVRADQIPRVVRRPAGAFEREATGVSVRCSTSTSSKQDTALSLFSGDGENRGLGSLLFTARFSHVEKAVLEGSGIKRVYFVFALKPSTLIQTCARTWQFGGWISRNCYLKQWPGFPSASAASEESSLGSPVGRW